MYRFIVILFIPIIIFSKENQSILNESIDYILDGNYIYKNQYINNDNNESYYYNNIYTLTSTKDTKNNYLKGLIEIDGEISKTYFEDYYSSYPNDEYADDSVVKVAEFYYSKGLYIQSSNWYKKITLEYPQSKHFQKSVSYFLNSLLISGHKDTADYYIKKFQKNYPKLKFSNEYLIETSMKEKSTKRNIISDSINQNKYSVQIGSFKNYDLAKAKKTLLGNEGFLCRIDEMLINGDIFYSVRIGMFNNYNLAIKEQKRLISRVGLYDSIIIEVQ